MTERTALYTTLALLGAVTLAISVAIRAGRLPEATILAFAAVALLVGLRWPLLPLFAFAALIPFESVVIFGDLGTISRLAGVLFAAAYAVPRLGRLTLRAMPAPAWAYVGWAALSLGWALDIDVARAQLVTLIQLFAIAVLVADVVVHRPTIVRPLLWVYSASAAVTALIAIEAYLSGGIAGGVRVAAFGDQDVAQFAAILLPAWVFSLYELLNGRLLLLAGAVAATASVGIVLSGTRGVWLAMAVVLIFFILPRLERVRRVVAVGVVLSLVVVALQLPGVADLVTRRAEEAVPSGGAGRVDIWQIGASIFESAPLSGVGFNNFPIAYTPERIRASAIGTDTGLARAPHSILIGTLGELGVIGLALLALFIVPLVLRRGWGPDAAVVQAALASVMTAAFFLDVLNRKQVWLLLGLAAGLAYLTLRKEASSIEASRGLLRLPELAEPPRTELPGDAPPTVVPEPGLGQ